MSALRDSFDRGAAARADRSPSTGGGAPAPTALLIRLNDATLDHRPIRLDPLPRCDESELVETAERGQVRGREGSVGHVEVFRPGSVRTSILEDLDLYPGTDALPATRCYTFNCEEPPVRRAIIVPARELNGSCFGIGHG